MKNYYITLLVTLFLFSTSSKNFSQQYTSDEYTAALYHFNNDSTTNILYDASGNGHHGTIIGATWENNGKYGKALSFNGVDNYVLIPSPDNMDLTQGYSIEAWVKPYVYGTNPNYGFGAYVISGPDHQTFEFAIHQQGSTADTRHTRFIQFQV